MELTVYTDIQSELHQKKRRFTDFIFQRVQIGGSKGAGDSSSDAAAAAANIPNTAPTSTASTPGQGRVRSPRSVSTTFFPKRTTPGSGSVPARTTRATAAGGGGGVPVIRATSPGAEFREERALAAARRQQEEAKQQRLKEPIQFVQPDGSAGKKDKGGDDTKTTATFPTSIRRFHISRPSTPVSPRKGAAGSGVSKSSTPTRTRAVLVEKLTQAPSLRGASILETLEKAEKNAAKGQVIDTVVQSQLVREDAASASRPQKRPVVNQAEKKWREQQKESISAAKQHLATKPEDDDHLDRLARDLEQVMLDIESEENQMEGVSLDAPFEPVTTQQKAPVVKPKTPMKYMPRRPTPRKPPVAKEEKDEDMDDGYVYDTYIRVPVPRSKDGLSDPLSDRNTLSPATPHDIDPTRKDIGLVVITQEDEDLWENFLENDDSDEENWDGEDVDSNGNTPLLLFFFFLSLLKINIDIYPTAEDNPANDYPDEELSSDDENDDPTAIYHRYRHAGSDEEEFDVNYYDEDSEDERQTYAHHHDYDDDDDKTLGRARRLQDFYRRQEEEAQMGRRGASDDEGDDGMY